MIAKGNTLLNKTEVNEIKHKITKEQEVRISEQTLKVEQGQTPHTLICPEHLRCSVYCLWRSLVLP